MNNLTRAQEWVIKAEEDLKVAEYLSATEDEEEVLLPIGSICFHCQQAAEKYLKGFLVLNGIDPPKTHDLDDLCELCAEISDSFKNIADQCSELTAYAVQPRYPTGMELNEQDMRDALNNARAIRDFVLNIAPEMKVDKSR